jgi:hypothetical protein
VPLTFQRHKPKRFLNTRVDEEIGRLIITREISGVRTILNPGDVFPAAAGLQLSKFLPLRPIADDQQIKFTGTPPLQEFESSKKCLSVLFSGQTAHVNSFAGACSARRVSLFRHPASV